MGGIFLSLKFDINQIESLMESFYTLSGIRFVLFDNNFHEVISYPKENCNFCKIMKSCPKTRRKCNYADRRSFEKCEKSNSMIIYNCHAGLVEAVIPLHDNEKIIGYLMFGQITDNPDIKLLYSKIPYWSEKYNLDEKSLTESIGKITYKTHEEILAAAKIMEACTSYIMYKELITPEVNRIVEAAKAYIEEHLNEEIDIQKLCEILEISRTRLYESFRQELNIGVAKYIVKRRLHKAKKLLKTTDFSITDIALQVGFSDYNYFSRVYKKKYGISPKEQKKRYH